MSTITILQKLSIASAGAVLVGLGTVSSAQAFSFTESGDAGQTLSTAQRLAGGITQIRGNYQSNNADLYSFLWNGGTFAANTLGSSVLDPQLFLFNSQGLGVIGNDDNMGTLQSNFSLALSPGLYYLGISGYDYDPVSIAGYIFTDNFPGVETPTRTGGAFPLSDWNGYMVSSSGAYQINISETASESVPEPTSILGLLTSGVMGCIWKSKQKKKA